MSAAEPRTRPTPGPVDGREATAVEDDAEPDDLLPDDEVFHLLQCRRRRDAVRYLFEYGGGPVRMRDLAEQVAAWEHDTTVAALSSKERQRVYIPLYQTHLPKLDEAGVIEYDQHRGRVATGPRADQLASFLPVDVADGSDGGAAAGRAAAHGRRWARYYLGALAASGVLLAGAALGVPPFGALQWGVVAGLTALLFAAVSVGDLADVPGPGE